MRTILIVIFLSLILGSKVYSEPYSKILFQDENQIHISMKYDWGSHDNAQVIAVDHCKSKNKKYAFRVKRPNFLRSKLDKKYKKQGLRPSSHRIFEYICSNKKISVAPSFASSAGEKIEMTMWTNYTEETTLKSTSSQTTNNQPTDITFTINDKKAQCEAIGFTPKTEKFADCVLKLVELDVQTQNNNNIASAQNTGNAMVANEIKKRRQAESSRYLMDLGQQLLQPQSNVYVPQTRNCTVRSFGNNSRVTCY